MFSIKPYIQLSSLWQVFLSILTSCIIIPSVNGADDLQYDVQESQKEEAFKKLTWDTRSCMSEGVKVLLMQGARDSEMIASWVQKTCGGALTQYMTQNLGRPENETQDYIQTLAYREINHTPGLQHIDASLTNSRQQYKWGLPALLEGTIHSGTFNNCCISGKSTKQKYYFIRLKEATEIIGQDNDESEPSMSNVRTIQLGEEFADFRKLKIGQKVSVSCKELWYGNTGHYALPAYCSEAKTEALK